MSWIFHCSRPVIAFDGRARSSISLAAHHNFWFPSEVQPTRQQSVDWADRDASVEVHQLGSDRVNQIARMSGWTSVQNSVGFVRLQEPDRWHIRPTVTTCMELDERRFEAFRQLCDLMLLSPRPLKLTVSCGVMGFASPGGSGAPLLQEFTSGDPMWLMAADIQFYLSAAQEKG